MGQLHLRCRRSDECQDGDGEDGFDRSEEGEVADHHSGDSDSEPIRTIERIARRIGEEHRLDAELDRCAQSRCVQPYIRTDARRNQVAFI